MGEALSRSTRRRIRRPGASHHPIRPCERGGGRAVVQKDLSEVSLSKQYRVGHTFAYEIGVIGVRAERNIGIRRIALCEVSGELPELPI